MKRTPYEILNVAKSASDNEIKQAYLQKVKLYPPERNQDKFQKVHSAYEAIKDKKGRGSYELFNYNEADFEVLLEQIFHTPPPKLIGTDGFDKILQSSINNKIYSISTFNKEIAHE